MKKKLILLSLITQLFFAHELSAYVSTKSWIKTACGYFAGGVAGKILGNHLFPDDIDKQAMMIGFLFGCCGPLTWTLGTYEGRLLDYKVLAWKIDQQLLHATESMTQEQLETFFRLYYNDSCYPNAIALENLNDMERNANIANWGFSQCEHEANQDPEFKKEWIQYKDQIEKSKNKITRLIELIKSDAGIKAESHSYGIAREHNTIKKIFIGVCATMGIYALARLVKKRTLF